MAAVAVSDGIVEARAMKVALRSALFPLFFPVLKLSVLSRSHQQPYYVLLLFISHSQPDIFKGLRKRKIASSSASFALHPDLVRQTQTTYPRRCRTLHLHPTSASSSTTKVANRKHAKTKLSEKKPRDARKNCRSLWTKRGGLVLTSKQSLRV